jgi:hypothetical protein
MWRRIGFGMTTKHSQTATQFQSSSRLHLPSNEGQQIFPNFGQMKVTAPRRTLARRLQQRWHDKSKSKIATERIHAFAGSGLAHEPIAQGADGLLGRSRDGLRHRPARQVCSIVAFLIDTAARFLSSVNFGLIS